MITVSQVEASELFRSEPLQYFDVGAGEVGYRRIGSGPDVLFVHGWPLHGATYRKLLPYLADKITCHVIDLPGAGSSRFAAETPLLIDNHIASVRSVVEQLDLSSVAVVGQDSGGLIARHAMVGNPRLRSMGLINTEQSSGLTRLLKVLVASASLPGVASILRWVSGQERLRRSRIGFGSAFVDPTLVDGEFAEFFLDPLHSNADLLAAAVRSLRGFDTKKVDELSGVHARIDVPVKLVWGAKDPFFPVGWAKEMVDTFPDASLDVIADAGLFSHEERPAEVAASLLPTLLG